MEVKAILDAAKAFGANIGTPYETKNTVAENVEGTVIRKPNVPFEAYQLVVKDQTGELKVNISSQSYAPNKTKYNLVIQELSRPLETSTGTQIAKGTKMLRAI